jgi:uracil-DNA glycosylase family 4
MGLGIFSLSHNKPTPTGRAPRCGLCKLNATCRTPRMPPTGDGERKILIVAEAPGQKEDEQGIQLIGESGQRLRQHLDDLDVDLDRDCWKTNAVVCRPPKNRKPTPEEIEACRPILFETIAKFDPNVIVLLGGTAVESFMGVAWGGEIGSMEHWVGWTIPCQKPRAWVVPIWHPSYLLRMDQKVLDLLFRQHLETAISLADSKPPQMPDYASEVRVEVEPSRAARIIRRIAEAGRPISYDFECNCLKPETRGAKIYSCAISNRVATVAFPWHGDAQRAAIEVLDGPLPKIGANIQFEQRWHPVKNWAWDTFLAAHTLDNRQGIPGAKFQAFVRLGVPDYSLAVAPYLSPGKNGLNTIERAPLKQVLIYNGMDAITEYDVALDQMKEMGVDTAGYN